MRQDALVFAFRICPIELETAQNLHACHQVRAHLLAIIGHRRPDFQLSFQIAQVANDLLRVHIPCSTQITDVLHRALNACDLDPLAVFPLILFNVIRILGLDRQFCHQLKRFVVDVEEFDELDKLILDHISEYRIRLPSTLLTMRMAVAQLAFLVPAGQTCAEILVVFADRDRIAVRAIQKLRQREDVCLRRRPNRPCGQAAFLVNGRNVFQHIQIKHGTTGFVQDACCILLFMGDKLFGAAVADQSRV